MRRAELLAPELEHDRLTGRGYHRVRRVARTIADLGGRCRAGRRAPRRAGAGHASRGSASRSASVPHERRGPAGAGLRRGSRRRAGDVTATPGRAARATTRRRRRTPSSAVGCAPRGAIVTALADSALAVRWRAAATPELVEQVWLRCAAVGVEVEHLGAPSDPAQLDGADAPPVLFVRGDLDRCSTTDAGSPSSARATPPQPDARRRRRIGRGLADAGVHVVSGLARGIDGCAHRGVARAATARAGRSPWSASGLDVVYPREHRDLWARVAETGVLRVGVAARHTRRRRSASRCATGSSPPCQRGRSWSSRSAERGGSLITATLAGERGHRGDGRAGLRAQPGAPPAPTSCCATAPRRSSTRRRRARRAGARPPPCGAGARRAAASGPAAATSPCYAGVRRRAAHARRTSLGCRCRRSSTRRCRSPGSSSRAGSCETDGWYRGRRGAAAMSRAAVMPPPRRDECRCGPRVPRHPAA